MPRFKKDNLMVRPVPSESKGSEERISVVVLCSHVYVAPQSTPVLNELFNLMTLGVASGGAGRV